MTIYESLGPFTWKEVFESLKILFAVIGGVWALKVYSGNRKIKRAEWVHNIYRDFYLNKDFAKIRVLLEYRYGSTIGPEIVSAVDEKYEDISSKFHEVMIDLDNFLNYLDFVAYLYSEGNLKKEDISVSFGWWIENIMKDEYTYLKKYIKKFNYVHLEQILTKGYHV